MPRQRSSTSSKSNRQLWHLRTAANRAGTVLVTHAAPKRFSWVKCSTRVHSPTRTLANGLLVSIAGQESPKPILEGTQVAKFGIR
jgi:hypothetical protein